MEISKKMVKIAFDALEDKKADDIKIIDISSVSPISDYFIIASASNKSQMQALLDNVEEELEKNGFFPKEIEGRGNESWILLDYNDIIIHIFSEDDREFYDIERIWKDGKEVEISELD